MEVLNAMEEGLLGKELERCCASSVWVQSMIASRPYESIQHLLALADEKWWLVGEKEWRHAFLAHPRIGDVDALKAKFAKNPDAWEGGEQSGAEDATQQVLVDLKKGNDEYEERFGHIFLVCATGKSASEMLTILRERMSNSPQAEILIAAGEQGKITHLRLHKLLTSCKSKL